MGKTIYLECNTGISGDMTVAALLDLGANWERLEHTLASIDASGFEIKKSRVKKAGIDCMDFDVVLDAHHENHDHDMEYLHGHDHEHHHDLDHEHEHCHDHEHHHDHEHSHSHEHHHEHRGLAEVNEIIDKCQMTDKARKIAKDIFMVLAKSEAKAHATSLENVHFHEVGAIDSIVDVISVAVCLDDLDVEDVIVSKLAEGCGTVRCQHGILSIPVPAVANILAEYPLSIDFTGRKGEFITPTGAAIAAAVQTKTELPKQFRIKGIGYGAGKRAYEVPSILRAMWIEEIQDEKLQEDVIYKLESNIDDATGEMLGYVMEKLFSAGARDVHYHPVYMKKNRPGWQLNVICTQEKVAEMERIIFSETTTIGIRKLKMERSVLKREMTTVQTSLGEVKVKVCDTPVGKRSYIEYESVADICNKTGLSYVEVSRKLQKEVDE